MFYEKWWPSSLDATKAFDKVLHYGLFHKMLCKGVPAIFVKLLATHLTSAVIWNLSLGECWVLNVKI